jgi:hypothetical protein
MATIGFRYILFLVICIFQKKKNSSNLMLVFVQVHVFNLLFLVVIGLGAILEWLVPLRIGYDVHKDLLSFVFFCFFFVMPLCI